MRTRLRYLLPTIQTLLGAVLLRHGYDPMPPVGKVYRQLDYQIGSGLNAPASLLSMQAYELVADWFNSNPQLGWPALAATWLSATWLLWYLVAVEIDGKGRSILARKAEKARLRRVLDLAAICFGEYLVVFGRKYISWALAGPAKTLVFMLWILWAQVIVWFHARDLWLSFCRPAEKSAPRGAPDISSPGGLPACSSRFWRTGRSS